MENRLIRFLHDIDQHIEAPAVGHADHNFLDPQLTAGLDHRLQRRDDGLGSIQSEPFGADEFAAQEFFELFGFHQFLQDRQLALICEMDFLVPAFDAFLDPGLFLRPADVHKFNPDRGTIGAV